MVITMVTSMEVTMKALLYAGLLFNFEFRIKTDCLNMLIEIYAETNQFLADNKNQNLKTKNLQKHA